MKTSTPGASPATGSRRIRIPVTSTSSRAQPVTAIDPTTPVAPSVGVSKLPKGPADVVNTVSVAAIVPVALLAPTNVSVMLPVCEAARPRASCVETVSVAEPLPAAGDTTSHGDVEVAVQVTVPAPVCVRRTVCGDVALLDAAPLATAEKASDERESDIVGGGPLCVMANV